MYVAVKKGITITPRQKKNLKKEQTETLECSGTLSWVEKGDSIREVWTWGFKDVVCPVE